MNWTPFLDLLQQNVFPDRGTVYDFYFVKQASGLWNNWIERVDKTKNVIAKDAKVMNLGESSNNRMWTLQASSQARQS